MKQYIIAALLVASTVQAQNAYKKTNVPYISSNGFITGYFDTSNKCATDWFNTYSSIESLMDIDPDFKIDILKSGSDKYFSDAFTIVSYNTLDLAPDLCTKDMIAKIGVIKDKVDYRELNLALEKENQERADYKKKVNDSIIEIENYIEGK
jgi:glutaredoxin